jgi:phosphoribosylformylglycinamidine (FGAM) synthase PurS component
MPGSPRPGVRHPEAGHPRSAGEGSAALAAFAGVPEVGDVRVGKYIELRLREVTKEAAAERVREMCERLSPTASSRTFRVELGEDAR